MWEQALHTTRGRKRKLRIFEPSQGFDTPLTRSLKNPRFLCRPRVTILPSLQSRLKRLCSRGADSRRPKGPNRADNGSNRLLLHIEVWTTRLPLSDRGALTPDTLPRSRPEEHGWT